MLKQLNDQRAKLANDMRAMVTESEKANRPFSADEQQKWDGMKADIEALDARIERVKTVDGFEATAQPVMHTINAGSQPTEDDAKKYEAAFDGYLRSRNDSQINAETLATLERPVISRNGRQIRAAQTVTTSGGGYLIPQGFSNQLEEAMKFYGGVLQAAEVFETETGNPLPWPTVNDTGNTGRILGINTAVTTTDFAFGQVVFNSYMFSSDQILVPIQLMQDSYFDLPSFIARRLGERLGRILNTKLTVGSGSNEPNGVLTAATAGVTGATGSTVSPKYADLISLIHSVDPAYRMAPTARFMLHDQSLKAIKQLVDGQSRPLWVPGTSSAISSGKDPDTILGYPYTINQDMPVMAANAKSILFGDFSKYKVRRVAGGATVLRLNERYADNLQVGFIGFLRADGQLVDAGTHPISIYTNSAT
jgi:HK97 family phage major capsid protein